MTLSNASSSPSSNQIRPLFISIGANRISGCSDWYRLPAEIYNTQVYTKPIDYNTSSETNNCIRVVEEGLSIRESYKHLDLFAYAANQFVAIYSPYYNRVLCTLKGHDERVNSVQFLIYPNKNEFQTHTIYVASVGGKQLLIWKLNVHGNDPSQIDYEIVQKISTKTHLTKVTALYHSHIAVCDSDGNVQVYSSKDHQYELIQTFKHSKSMEAISIIDLFNSGQIMVACGGVDFNIYLYFVHPNNTKPILVLKGHEDWIRSLSFKYIEQEKAVYLASASQDNRIRIWKMIQDQTPVQATSDSLLEEELLVNLYNTHHFTSIDSSTHYQVTLDTLLTGHEDWVHSLNWHPCPNLLQLLSTSMDRTMMIWSPTSNHGVWLNQFRMGEFGGLSGLFGQMGYFSGCFSMFGDYCMGTAFHGSFHLWKLKEHENEWKPMVSISGHFNSVMDLDVEPSKDGIYFMTTSTDQTTRCFTWVDTTIDSRTIIDNDSLNQYQTCEERSIREIARTQIHGYDMNCLTFTDYYSFASGGDEKVIRYFDAPQSFINTLCLLNSKMGHKHYELYGQSKKERVMAATVPPLGLTNKSVKEGEEKDMITVNEFDYQDEEESTTLEALDDHNHEKSLSSIFAKGNASALPHPPFETQLLQLTLWPEQQKLYGHANEMICVQSNHCKSVLASACSAKHADAAQIRLWDIRNGFKPIDVVMGHNLTVSRIAFSNNDEWMCSVSRDRCMILYQRKRMEQTSLSFDTYEPLLYQQCHERIIWDVSFSVDDLYVATGSRDGTVKVFRVPSPMMIEEISKKKEEKSHQVNLECVQSIEMPQPVTSIQFIPKLMYEEFREFFQSRKLSCYLMAIGMEDGSIQIYDQECEEINDKIHLKLLYSIPNNHAHASTVRRVKWRVDASNPNHLKLELLTCSLDFSVRVFQVIA
ncbi:hypothetical protein C9374_001737 [Naegleria lovaniensis]|uniref:Elongator complex protein 2 n=1 Tax=Naegleria lovaniensis TaxID=51637 RepID=A0AA88GV00_NAELO|nr:uncharacterized protein C9374_001737 [Naegleria lovaniensis]KAG2387405.1 hypothetical protein C9374_001737 [Naegleria lovaniensis]